MGDPLSDTASFIAVAQIAGSIIGMCYEYQSAVRNGPRDIERVLQEVKALRDLTEKVLGFLNDSPNAPAHLPSLRGLSEKNGVILQCQSDLQSLETKLKTPISEWKRLARRLLWPLQEKEMMKTLDSIHRMKSIVELGLHTDNTAVILEIRETTRSLEQRITEYRRSTLTEQQKLQVVLEWLDAPDQSHKYAQVLERREKGTCEWLLSSTSYVSWKDADRSSMWLNGIAGCGKTVLASVVIHDLYSNVVLPSTPAVAYYYFDFNESEKSSPEMLLRSLVSQLSIASGELPTALAQYALEQFHSRRKKGIALFRDGIAQPSATGLMKVLRSIIEQLRPTYLIFDALDESLQREETLHVVHQMITWKLPGLHIFFTSRTETEISTLFATEVDSVIPIRSNLTDKDIDLMVKRQVQAQRRLSRWPPKLRSEIEESLTKGAQGMFRWVECQLRLLTKCATVNDVRKTLSKLPKTLEDTYAAILANIDDAHINYAMRILMWLAVSSNPITVDDAIEILAVDLEAQNGPVFNPELRLLDPQDLSVMCSTLVITTRVRQSIFGQIVERRQLRLSHHTVKEYLLNGAQKMRQEPVAFPSVFDVHSNAAETLLTYLLSLSQICTPEVLDEFPLARYAAKYWLRHLSEVAVPYPPALIKEIMKLFQNNGDTEPYRNWGRLFDPIRPWAQPDLERRKVPSPTYLMSSQGRKEIVRHLLTSVPKYGKDEDCHASLLIASSGGHTDVVRLLIEAGADVNWNDGRHDSTALSNAAAGGHLATVTLLLQNGADANRHHFGTPGQALCQAARRGYSDIVRALIDGGADPNRHDIKVNDVNAVKAAVSRGYKDCVEIMLPKATQETALLALFLAFHRKDRDMIDVFVKYVPEAVMHYSAALGYQDLVTDLLRTGVKTETLLVESTFAGSFEGSSLAAACEHGRLDVVRQLLERGADVNYQSETKPHYQYETHSDNNSAVAHAARGGHMDLVRLLLSHGADVNIGRGTGPPLQIAIYRGQMEMAKELFAHGASLTDDRGVYGGPVQAAVLGNHFELLQWIVATGADVNMIARHRDIYGDGAEPKGTPLQGAVASSNMIMVDWLLEHGADVNLGSSPSPSTKQPGSTPLLRAIQKRNVEMVSRLLAAGADVNQSVDGYGGGSPLFHAVHAQDAATVSILTSHGADPNGRGIRYGHEVSLLTAASMESDVEIVRELLRAGADVHRQSQPHENNEPPIHTASRSSTPEVIRALVEHGADVNAQLQDGWTPLHMACRSAQVANVRALLLDHNANAKTLSLVNGSLPIHSAAARGSVDCLRLMVETAGVDINVRNGTGRTPLHWAAQRGSLAGTEWLIQNGADVTLKEFEADMTAEDYAQIALRDGESWEREEREEVVALFCPAASVDVVEEM